MKINLIGSESFLKVYSLEGIKEIKYTSFKDFLEIILEEKSINLIEEDIFEEKEKLILTEYLKKKDLILIFINRNYDNFNKSYIHLIKQLQERG